MCGSTTFEQVDESHIRCVECGHGATVTRLVAVANPNPSSADIARAEERFRDIDDRTLGSFKRAPFRPFALDDRWSGLRFFGGHGGSGDRTTSLGLAFGEDVRDPSLPEVRVETRVRDFDAIDDPVVAAKMDAFMWRATRSTTSGGKLACYGTTFDAASFRVMAYGLRIHAALGAFIAPG